MTIVYVISGIVILFMSMQFFLRFQSKFKKGKDATVLTGYIGDAVRRGGKVLLYFYSPTCGACRQQTTIIDRLPNTPTTIFKVDVSKDAKTAMAIGVLGTPSTAIIENGVIKEFFLGFVNQEKLLKLLQ
ncbi:MAG: thioredoxin family protein [Ignavibacteriales bacterium]|nr:thioredoxin family protein [Ignavibacteriales bacterium]